MGRKINMLIAGVSLFAIGYTGYSGFKYTQKEYGNILQKPQVKNEKVIEYKNIDYSNRFELENIWDKFPKDTKYSIVKDEMNKMGYDQLFDVSRSVLLSKIQDNPISSKKYESQMNKQQVFDMLRNYVNKK
jgi:hypothetical protein